MPPRYDNGDGGGPHMWAWIIAAIVIIVVIAVVAWLSTTGYIGGGDPSDIPTGTPTITLSPSYTCAGSMACPVGYDSVSSGTGNGQCLNSSINDYSAMVCAGTLAPSGQISDPTDPSLQCPPGYFWTGLSDATRQCHQPQLDRYHAVLPVPASSSSSSSARRVAVANNNAAATVKKRVASNSNKIVSVSQAKKPTKKATTGVAKKKNG